jgi:hypothetical protein
VTRHGRSVLSSPPASETPEISVLQVASVVLLSFCGGDRFFRSANPSSPVFGGEHPRRPRPEELLRILRNSVEDRLHFGL